MEGRCARPVGGYVILRQLRVATVLEGDARESADACADALVRESLLRLAHTEELSAISYQLSEVLGRRLEKPSSTSDS